MKIFPYISGRGSAGQAIAKSWAILSILEPELQIQPVTFLARNEKWLKDRAQGHKSVLCIATPHGKHAQQIASAESQGFDAVFCEKPAAIDREQLMALNMVDLPVVAIFHGYRQMWGPKTLKNLIAEGAVGNIFSIEGRYWQASAAKYALLNGSATPDRTKWKNDPAISGPYDVFLDLGTHWADLMTMLAGKEPTGGSVWKSYVNAEVSHRDTHIHLTIDFPGIKTLGSISKTIHGAGNHLEINVLGNKGTLTWNFMNPDEVIVAKGGERQTLMRQTSDLGSKQNAFHATGWLEGYIEILRQGVYHLTGRDHESYPSLKNNVVLLDFLFSLPEMKA